MDYIQLNSHHLKDILFKYLMNHETLKFNLNLMFYLLIHLDY